MESLVEENFKILEEHHPLAWQKIRDAMEEPGINIIQSKSGNPVPEITVNNRKIYLHSRFDPLKEAERFISEMEPEKFDLLIIMGFAFAYHAEILLKRIQKDATLLIIEKSPALLKKAARSRPLSELLNDKRVKILIDPGEDEIADTLKGKSSYRVTFATHRGSHQFAPEYYENIKKTAMSCLSTKNVNIATLSKFEKNWSLNIARNIRAFPDYPGANIFYGKFNRTPALVVSAGPSLTGSIDFIKASSKKAIIIAVDTSYRILKKHGIEPHFCVTVDPQIINARYFEGDTDGRTILITDPTVHPSVFRLYRGNKALIGVAFEMMKWIEKIIGDNGELAYGGSVSTNAYDFAKRVGASPIVLLGQDLSFTRGLAHARGSYLDEEVQLRTDRFYNMLMFNRRQLTALPVMHVNGLNGEKTATNQKMMIFISWFEKRNDPDLINATPEGAVMKGVRHKNPEEIELPVEDRDIFSEITGIYGRSARQVEDSEKARAELLIKCETMLNDLGALIPVIERAVSLSDELVSIIGKNTGDSRLQYILNKLSEADKKIQSRDTLKDMISFTIQRVIHTITEGYEIDENDGSMKDDELVAKRSNYLYRGLFEGAIFNKKILNKMIAILSR